MRISIDLNCDTGEAAAHDEELMAIVSSANIACGGHAGDEASMRRAVEQAIRHGAGIGAHPSLVDREGFGRRELPVEPEALERDLRWQIEAIERIARSAGAGLSHVKPHGALYSMAARDERVGEALVRAVLAGSRCRTLFLRAGSPLVARARRAGLVVAEEAFADRGYRSDGSLVPRGSPGGMVADAAEAARRAVRMAIDGLVRAVDGADIRLRADTICIHGDEPEAVLFAREIAAALRQAGVSVKRFGSS